MFRYYTDKADMAMAKLRLRFAMTGVNALPRAGQRSCQRGRSRLSKKGCSVVDIRVTALLGKVHTTPSVDEGYASFFKIGTTTVLSTYAIGSPSRT